MIYSETNPEISPEISPEVSYYTGGGITFKITKKGEPMLSFLNLASDPLELNLFFIA